MRTVDEPEKFKGFGDRVEKPKPAPAPAPKPQGRSGIVTDKNGRMSTTTHIPRLTALEAAIWNWREHYSADIEVDFLP